MIDYSVLQTRVVNTLKTELDSEDSFSLAILGVKVECAIEDVMTARCYENTCMDDEAILKDLNKHYSIIVNLARYDYNQRGAEGQESHNENSVNRKWVDRKSYLGMVKPFVKCL